MSTYSIRHGMPTRGMIGRMLKVELNAGHKMTATELSGYVKAPSDKIETVMRNRKLQKTYARVEK
jgi:2-iminoacetate synthase ThiH